MPPFGVRASDSHLTYFPNYFYPDCSSWQVSKQQCDFVCRLQLPPLQVSRRESFDLAGKGDTSQFSSVCKCQLRRCEALRALFTGSLRTFTGAQPHECMCTHHDALLPTSSAPLLPWEARASARLPPCSPPIWGSLPAFDTVVLKGIGMCMREES